MWEWITGQDEKIADVKKVLTQYVDYLAYQDVFSMIINSLVWGLIKLFYKLNLMLENTIYKSFELKGLLNAAGIQEMYQDLISKVLAILCVCTLMYLGLKFAVSKNPPKAKNIFVNLFMAMILIFGGSSMIDEAVNVAQGSYNDITQANKGDKTAAPSFQLIKDNTYDIETVMKTDASKLGSVATDKRNALTAKNFKYTNINAVMTPEQAENIAGKKTNETIQKRYEALSYKMDLNDKGELTPVKISDDGLAKYFYTSGYRRYMGNSGIILAGEISLTFAYIYILFSIVICLIELGFKKFYLVIAASTDFETGQRMKTATEDIIQSLLLLAFTGLELRIYTKMLSGLSDLNSQGKVTGLLFVIALFALTIALYKGSQAVTKIFGVNTSLKQGGNMLMNAFALSNLARTGASAGKSVKDSAKDGLSKLNEIRKNAFSSPTKTEEDNNTGNDSGNIPRSGGKLSEVFGKVKSGAKTAVETAGYVSERGGKQAVQDVAGKAKEAVSEKLEDTRAGSIVNAAKAAKDIAKDPKAAIEEKAESAKEAVGNLQGRVVDTFEDGQMKALEKGMSENKKPPTEDPKPEAPKTRAVSNPEGNPTHETVDPKEFERKVNTPGLKESSPVQGPNDSDKPKAGSSTITENEELKVKKQLNQSTSLERNETIAGETTGTAASIPASMTDPGGSETVASKNVTKRVDTSQLFKENTNTTIQTSSSTQKQNNEMKDLLLNNQSKK